MSPRGPRFAALAAYFLLSSVYLIYWAHADFVLDDWFQLLFYTQKQAVGWQGQLELAGILIRNKLYSTFQLYWLSFLIDSLLVGMVGYSPRILFSLTLLLHTVNAWLFYRLLCRLRVSARLAFLAGACFVLIPLAHGSLFWFLATSFYVHGPFFLFLYLLSVIDTLEKGTLTLGAASRQALLIAAVLFTGGAPSFYLLLFGGPLMAVCFFPRREWKVAAKTTVLNWVVAALLLGIYVPFINAIPPTRAEMAARYDFRYDFFAGDWGRLYYFHRLGLSGVGRHAYYHLQADGIEIVAALFAAAVVFLFARRLPETSPEGPCSLRTTAFAAGMTVLAYAPLAFLIGVTLRHYYTFSPYLSLLAVTLCWMAAAWRGHLAAVAAGAVFCAYFAACTVAEIEQCWIPNSRHLQAVKAGLLRLKNLEPKDLVVIPRFPVVTGTAPNFALIQAPWDRCFAEHITGVKDPEFWREIVVEKGRLRLFHRHFMRDTSLAELTRAHVLRGEPEGPYRPCRYWAEEVGPGEYRLHCLKDSPCTAPSQLFTGDQLRPSHEEIYFPRPFEHGNPEHLHY